MFYQQTFFPLQICSSLHCSQQIPEEKIGGHRARLREKENLFRYRGQFEGNLLRFARARAHVRALMTQKSCAVEMRNAILRNYLNYKSCTNLLLRKSQNLLLLAPEVQWALKVYRVCSIHVSFKCFEPCPYLVCHVTTIENV